MRSARARARAACLAGRCWRVGKLPCPGALHACANSVRHAQTGTTLRNRILTDLLAAPPTEFGLALPPFPPFGAPYVELAPWRCRSRGGGELVGVVPRAVAPGECGLLPTHLDGVVGVRHALGSSGGSELEDHKGRCKLMELVLGHVTNLDLALVSKHAGVTCLLCLLRGVFAITTGHRDIPGPRRPCEALRLKMSSSARCSTFVVSQVAPLRLSGLRCRGDECARCHRPHAPPRPRRTVRAPFLFRPLCWSHRRGFYA